MFMDLTAQMQAAAARAVANPAAVKEMADHPSTVWNIVRDGLPAGTAPPRNVEALESTLIAQHKAETARGVRFNPIAARNITLARKAIFQPGFSDAWAIFLRDRKHQVGDRG